MRSGRTWPRHSRGWPQRSSRRTARRVLGAVYLVGFALWSWAVRDWAERHGHQDWLVGPREFFLLPAGLTFWPLAVLSWWLLCPADPRLLPWDDPDER